MKVTVRQLAGTIAIVNYFEGNPDLVKEAVEELESPEMISCSPGPSIHHLPIQEQIALTTIKDHITGPDCSIPVTQACKILEEVVCRNMEPPKLEQYIRNLDQSFARNSVPFKKALLSNIQNSLAPVFCTFFGGLFITTILTLLAFTQSNSEDSYEIPPAINKVFPETEAKPPSSIHPSFDNIDLTTQYPELRNYKPDIYIYSPERFQNKKKEKKESLP